MKFANKVGTVFYVIWGILHFNAAYNVYALAAEVPDTMSMVQARLFQNAWNLAFLALFAIVLALAFNWRNSRAGFWLNLAVVSGTDIGFIAFVLIPGLLPLVPGAAGPIFWLLGAFFTGLGRARAGETGPWR